MKYLILFTIFLTGASCKSEKKKFQPLADNMKQHFLEIIPDIKSVDTMYILVDTVTSRLKGVIQSAEYLRASTEAKNSGNPDRSVFETKSMSTLYESESFDDKTFLYYRARPLVVFHTNNSKMGMAEKWLYFDKYFRIVDQYSFIERASQNNDNLSLREYAPLSPDDYKNIKESGILTYY